MVDYSRFNLVPTVSPLVDRLDRAVNERKKQAAQDDLNFIGQQSTNALYLSSLEDPHQIRKGIYQMARNARTNSKDFNKLIEMANIEDPDELRLALTIMGTKGQEARKTLMGRMPETGKPEPFAQGTGAMSGYVFNPNTGQYAIDPVGYQALIDDAQKDAAEKGMLDAGKIAGINDKVTGLTKDAVEIVTAAKDLEALKDRGTPAAQISAVFKFMKANDPTSTVRESELGMVYSAEGAMRAFANWINSLMGEGRLSPENFQDVADTAKIIANSAVDSSSGVVKSYLDVLSDKIEPEDYQQMLSRVPTKLGIQDNQSKNGRFKIEVVK